MKQISIVALFGQVHSQAGLAVCRWAWLGCFSAATAIGYAPAVWSAETRQGGEPLPEAQPLLVAQAGGLQRGDTGPAVGDLQARLRNLGFYGGEIDQVFGAETEAAVIRFQSASGLTADGIVGPQTLDRLARSTGQVPSVAPTLNDNLLQLGDRGEAVRDLQIRLSNLGFYQGIIDGVYGASTEVAVIAFQRSQGLTADGVVGPQTLAALSRDGSSDRFPTLPPPPISTLPALPPPPAAPPQSSVGFNTGRPTGRFTVAELQRRLQERGFYRGPIDGIVGPQTRTAISAAQRAYNLSYGDIVEGRFE